MLGHELRNPLAPIRNALGFLKMPGATEDEVREASETIERQVEHLVRLVDDLLDVSRIMHGTSSCGRSGWTWPRSWPEPSRRCSRPSTPEGTS